MRRRGGWLALAALALQLVLSFGHIHAAELIGSLGIATATASLHADRHDEPAGSQDPADDAAVEGACAICASMALAGTLVMPDAVKLPLPSGVAEGTVRASDQRLLSGGLFRLFQPRAPPAV